MNIILLIVIRNSYVSLIRYSVIPPLATKTKIYKINQVTIEIVGGDL